MEDMSAWQLFWCRVGSILLLCRRMCRSCWNHLLSANDAGSIVHSCEFLFSCIRISLIHVFGCSLVAMKRSKTSHKGSGSDVDVSDEVQRQPIERDDDNEKDEVCCQLHEV